MCKSIDAEVIFLTFDVHSKFIYPIIVRKKCSLHELIKDERILLYFHNYRYSIMNNIFDPLTNN